jgi:hypothetical protein
MNAIIACPEAATEEIRFAFGTFSLGTVLVAASIKAVVAILMSDDRDALRRAPADAFPHARLVPPAAGRPVSTARFSSAGPVPIALKDWQDRAEACGSTPPPMADTHDLSICGAGSSAITPRIRLSPRA